MQNCLRSQLVVELVAGIVVELVAEIAAGKVAGKVAEIAAEMVAAFQIETGDRGALRASWDGRLEMGGTGISPSGTSPWLQHLTSLSPSRRGQAQGKNRAEKASLRCVGRFSELKKRSVND